MGHRLRISQTPHSTAEAAPTAAPTLQVRRPDHSHDIYYGHYQVTSPLGTREMILQKRTLVLLLSFLILLLAKILPHGAPDHVVWLAGKDELIFLPRFLPRFARDVGPDGLLFVLILLLLLSMILPQGSIEVRN